MLESPQRRNYQSSKASEMLYHYQEIADLLGCSRHKVADFVNEGHLTAVILPGQKRKRISQTELNKFISSLTKGVVNDASKKENPVHKYKKSNPARNKVA